MHIKQNSKFQILNSRFSRQIGIAFLFAVVGAFIPGNDAIAELAVKANHDHIKIDFFYHGSSVSVRGASDPGTDLIIKIASPEGHETLKKKGKVAGFLWMNVGDLKLEHAPNLYMVHSTGRLDEMLNAGDLERHVIGYPALKKHIGIAPAANQAEKDMWFSEFLKLKQDSNLYAMSEGKISVTKGGGKQNYYVLLDWPYQAPPGDYTVTVYAVKDKIITDTAEATVKVAQVGLVETLSSMAKKNAALYGFISVAAALGAGFGVGMVFRKGGGAH